MQTKYKPLNTDCANCCSFFFLSSGVYLAADPTGLAAAYAATADGRLQAATMVSSFFFNLSAYLPLQHLPDVYQIAPVWHSCHWQDFVLAAETARYLLPSFPLPSFLPSWLLCFRLPGDCFKLFVYLLVCLCLWAS